MFGLIRSWRRSRIREGEFPETWRGFLREHAPFYGRLDDARREKLEGDVLVFVTDKHFFGAGGLELTDEHRVVIAACAARLVLHLDIALFDRLTEIVVYPSAYRHPERGNHDGSRRGGGVILGEAHHFGTVVLSWRAVVSGLANPCDGHDTAAHEFAHVLDREAGGFNGTPRLHATEDYRVWGTVMSQHFNALKGGEDDELTVLRRYGATNEAEFFAVATESFFEKPHQMKRLTPELYDVLARFYRFDSVSQRLCAAEEDGTA